MVRAFRYEQSAEGIIMPEHWHENLEFVSVVSGGMSVNCCGNSINAQGGDIIVINSEEIHGYECTAAPLVLSAVVADMFVLNSRLFDSCEIKYIQPIINKQILFSNYIQGDTIIASCIEQIVRENESAGYGFEFAVKSHLYGLLTQLLRSHTAKSPPIFDKASADYNNMDKVMLYIEQNYTARISLDVLAEHANLSKYHFCRLFKKLTGRTPFEYVNYLRVNEAIALISDTSASITDIAYQVGFNDANYFCRVFKETTGYTPSSIKSMLRK